MRYIYPLYICISVAKIRGIRHLLLPLEKPTRFGTGSRRAGDIAAIVANPKISQVDLNMLEAPGEPLTMAHWFLSCTDVQRVGESRFKRDPTVVKGQQLKIFLCPARVCRSFDRKSSPRFFFSLFLLLPFRRYIPETNGRDFIGFQRYIGCHNDSIKRDSRWLPV